MSGAGQPAPARLAGCSAFLTCSCYAPSCRPPSLPWHQPQPPRRHGRQRLCRERQRRRLRHAGCHPRRPCRGVLCGADRRGQLLFRRWGDWAGRARELAVPPPLPQHPSPHPRPACTCRRHCARGLPEPGARQAAGLRRGRRRRQRAGPEAGAGGAVGAGSAALPASPASCLRLLPATLTLPPPCPRRSWRTQTSWPRPPPSAYSWGSWASLQVRRPHALLPRTATQGIQCSRPACLPAPTHGTPSPAGNIALHALYSPAITGTSLMAGAAVMGLTALVPAQARVPLQCDGGGGPAETGHLPGHPWNARLCTAQAPPPPARCAPPPLHRSTTSRPTAG